MVPTVPVLLKREGRWFSPMEIKNMTHLEHYSSLRLGLNLVLLNDTIQK